MEHVANRSRLAPAVPNPPPRLRGLYVSEARERGSEEAGRLHGIADFVRSEARFASVVSLKWVDIRGQEFCRQTRTSASSVEPRERRAYPQRSVRSEQRPLAAKERPPQGLRRKRPGGQRPPGQLFWSHERRTRQLFHRCAALLIRHVLAAFRAAGLKGSKRSKGTAEHAEHAEEKGTRSPSLSLAPWRLRAFAFPSGRGESTQRRKRATKCQVHSRPTRARHHAAPRIVSSRERQSARFIVGRRTQCALRPRSSWLLVASSVDHPAKSAAWVPSGPGPRTRCASHGRSPSPRLLPISRC